MIEDVLADDKITIHLDTSVEETDGFVGNFATKLSNNAVLDHGAIVIASGGTEYVPEQYQYQESDRVITQRELENKLASQEPSNDQTYVMIQCVGSREEPDNYCSRICCQDALKNSIAIKEKAPEAQVAVLYRDMRAYGLKEDYYKKARDLGVLFFLYVPEKNRWSKLEQTGAR